MTIVYALIFVTIALFALEYYLRRRFGILALALTSGWLLSTMWAVPLAHYIKNSGYDTGSLPLTSVVSIVIILLPAIVLLYGGQSYNKPILRIVGAAFFAILAASYLAAPLGIALAPDEMGTFYINQINSFKPVIITAAIIYAVVDIMIPRLPSKADKKKK